MKEQSGRSLIEMLGVIAIAAIMTAGAIKMYQVVRTRQIRMIATEDMKSIAENTKMLYAARDNYNDISIEYLVKAGAMRNEKSPLPTAEFSIVANPVQKEFAMVFSGLNYNDCSWLSATKFDWADRAVVNGYEEAANSYCKKLDKNEVVIWVK